MSDYTQTVDFSAKDSLATGDPAKKIKGADIDTELAAISTAISSKAENATAETISGDWTHSGDLTVSGTTTLSGAVTGLDWQLLAAATASADDYITFAAVIDDDTYDHYVITGKSIIPTSDYTSGPPASPYLGFQLGHGGTPTWIAGANYEVGWHSMTGGAHSSLSGASSSGHAGGPMNPTGSGNQANEVMNFRMEFCDLGQASNNLYVRTVSWGLNQAAALYENKTIVTVTNPSAAITSIRFHFGTWTSTWAVSGTNTIASGDFKVYGLRNA